MKWMFKKVLSVRQQLNLAVIAILLLSIPLGIYLIRSFVLYRPGAIHLATRVCFTVPAQPIVQDLPCPVVSYNIPGDSPIPVWLDSNEDPVSSIRVDVAFDTSKLVLTGEIPRNTADSRMNVFFATTMTDANSTGKITIIEGVNSFSNLPVGQFKFIDLPFGPAPLAGSNQTTTISVDQSTLEILDGCNPDGTGCLSLGGASQTVNITVNPAVVATPTPTPTPPTTISPLTCSSGDTLHVIAPCALDSSRRIYDLTFLNSIANYTIPQATFQGRGTSTANANFFNIYHTGSCTTGGGVLVAAVGFPFTPDFIYPNPLYIGQLVKVAADQQKFLKLEAGSNAELGPDQNLHMCVGGTGGTPIPTATPTTVGPSPTPTSGVATPTPTPVSVAPSIIIDPVSKLMAPNEEFTAIIKFRTGTTISNAKTISAMTLRIRYPFSGTSPELDVVLNTQGKPVTPILTNDWSFPVNSVTKSGGFVTIDLAAVNDNTAGFSTVTETPLASIRFRAVRKPTTNPINLACDSTETKMLSKTEPITNVLVQPISNYCKASYSIVDFATLAFGFSMQGVTISGVSRSSDLTVSNINLTRVLPVNVLSGGSGIFNPSPSPVQLIDQNGVPIPVTSAGVAYDIFEKAPGYLRKKLGNLTLFPGVNTAPTSWNTIRLLAGDFSTPTLAFDNVLNIFDLGAILSVYTQLSVPITSVDMKQYDIDGNNVLNIIDIAYVLSNYTQLQVPGD